MREADIPEDRLVYAEVMYDVFYLNKKKKKKCEFPKEKVTILCVDNAYHID